jgi:hypothetical protein
MTVIIGGVSFGLIVMALAIYFALKGYGNTGGGGSSKNTSSNDFFNNNSANF